MWQLQVFITPLFMPHGDSVMVKVARGGAAKQVCRPHLRLSWPLGGTWHAGTRGTMWLVRKMGMLRICACE